MKILLTTFFLIFIVFITQAEQLLGFSKDTAVKAAALIEKAGFIYVFCGCCDNPQTETFRVERVEIHHEEQDAEYYPESCYSISVIHKPAEFPETLYVDLAYTYIKTNNGYSTIASLLRLEHDPCKHTFKL